MAGLPLFDRIEESAICSVSELTAQIKATLEADFADVAVCGEVSNLSRPRSGHVYLSLKDESAQVRAVIWKSTAQRLPFDLADGLSVRVWGDLAVYAPRGEYQVTIRRVEPEGVGALELAFRQRFEKLRAEGLFDPDRKRPLPRFPRRIVVVSSPTGAAVRDFLQVTGRRWSASEILIAPARVQGLGAAEEVAAAIALANRVEGADLIVVARGGGSLEDLWAFNEEVVARAIAGSRIPVVSAIGHEVDVTLADPRGRLPRPDPERGRRAIRPRRPRGPPGARTPPGPAPPRRPRPPGRGPAAARRPGGVARPGPPPPGRRPEAPAGPARRRARSPEPAGRPGPRLRPGLPARRRRPAPRRPGHRARRPAPGPARLGVGPGPGRGGPGRRDMISDPGDWKSQIEVPAEIDDSRGDEHG